MDRESTPQKQRQKRSSSTRRSSTSHATPRGPQRPRSRPAAPAALMSKTPAMLLRPSANSSGVLYEPGGPDVSRRNRHSLAAAPDRENYLQVNTRLSANSQPSTPLDRRGVRSPGVWRPHTPSIQQTKIVPPSSSVKLITPQMQFATDLSIKLGQCLELTNFTVVGVLGLEGVGKSTVLSLLAQKEVEMENNIFSTRSLEAVVLDQHETTGVDLAVSMVGGSGHPTILLDSQPLLSSSMLADLLERNESQRFGALTPEQQVEAASYQIAVFLCAICHYVVVVHDGLAFQMTVHDLLRKIEQKVAQCRLPSVSGNSHKHAARLMFVANNVADAELLYRENELFSAHERALEAAWPQALVRVPYKISSYSDPGGEDDSILHTASFILPHSQQQSQKDGVRSSPGSSVSGSKTRLDRNKSKVSIGSSKYSDYNEAAKDFQRFVLSLPCSPSFTSQSIPMSTPTPGSKPMPPPHALSLREWLSNASRVFEGIRKASCFTAEYVSPRDHH